MARVLVAVGVLAGATVLQAAPAGAVITVSSSGTVATVSLTGIHSFVYLECGPNGFRAGNIDANPNIACATVTNITVVGDASNQMVLGDRLSATQFPNVSLVSVVLGTGSDYYSESPLKDGVNMGAGADTLSLAPYRGTAPDNTAALGGQSGDTVEVALTDQDDTLTFGSGSPNVTVNASNATGARSRTFGGATRVSVYGVGGNDTLNAQPIGVDLGSKAVLLYGGNGNDTLRSTPQGSFLIGGPGTNQLDGSNGSDWVESVSPTDTIVPRNGPDVVFDTESRRSGGRTLGNGGTGGHTWGVVISKGDAQVRVRPVAGQRAELITSLSRDGRQVLPTTFTGVNLNTRDIPTPGDRSVIDVVPLVGAGQVYTGDGADDLVDVLVPTGSWTLIGDPTDTAGSATLTFTGGYGAMTLSGVSLNVHAPFASAAQRWAHKMVRDLHFRFAGTSERNGIVAQLTGGSSRQETAWTYIDSDPYRALDVDRSYLTFLRRRSDAAGRQFWIDAIAGGSSLRTVRAKIFGSTEYFDKFGGGTNTGYVNAAYSDVLGRPPDASGQAYWVDQIESGVPRGTVARAFLSTAEARGAIVTEQFLRLVARNPTASELDTWKAALAERTDGEQALIAFLVGSTTYFGLD